MRGQGFRRSLFELGQQVSLVCAFFAVITPAALAKKCQGMGKKW
jgi:hypothetical protein